MKNPVTTKNTEKMFIGSAGEHLVLSRLLSQRVLATLAPSNFPDVDILVSPLNGADSKWIQVKSTETAGKNRGWSMRDGHLKLQSPKLFYCFVELSSEPQRVYVVPSRVVANVLTKVDRAYMRKPKLDGSKRTNHARRMLKPNFTVKVPIAPEGWMEKYLEAWDLIKR